MEAERQKNLEVAKSLFGFYQNRTFASQEEAGQAYEELARKIFHEKAVFEVVFLPPQMKLCCDGLENIVKSIKPLYSLIKESEAKLVTEEAFLDPSKFLLKYEIKYVLHTGNVYQNEYTMIFKVEEGKISRVWEHLNPFNLATFK